MRLLKLAIVIFASVAPVWPQAAPLKTADAVLDRYKQALGGVDAIAKVQSETVRGEIESSWHARKSDLRLLRQALQDTDESHARQRQPGRRRI